MGGLNGIFLSNTYWYHRALGWRGVLIEPTPASYEQLVKNRASDITINAAVCKDHQRVHYLNSPRNGVNGIVEFMSEEFKQRWHPTIKDSELLSISCVPLQPILNLVNLRHINFFSLDVEGGELEVIRGIDFNCTRFDVITMEANAKNPTEHHRTIRDILTSHGYIFHGQIQRNYWFVHPQFVPSVKPA